MGIWGKCMHFGSLLPASGLGAEDLVFFLLRVRAEI
jgi:hypothetical protein